MAKEAAQKDLTREDLTSDSPSPAPPTRSLRSSARSMNPQARMQELLREGTAPFRQEPAKEGNPAETPIAGNNEGNFIASWLPIKEENLETLNEDTEVNAEQLPQPTLELPADIVIDVPPKQTLKQGAKKGGKVTQEKPTAAPGNNPSASSPSGGDRAVPKQSLRDAVLEEGRGQEERVSKTRLNVDIDEDLHFWLKGHAIQNRRKLNDLIPRILKAYRDEVEGE